MSRLFWLLLAMCVVGTGAVVEAGKQYSEDFSNSRPKNWSVNFGSWEPVSGHLVCRQLEKDNHAAASRWQIPFADGTVQFRIRFAGAKFAHVGFDPARGELDKKGHLYSLVLSENKASIMKHKDKADAKSKNETLAEVNFAKPLEGWTNISLQAKGNKVTVAIGDHSQLEATDQTFGVKKPTVVFRVGGGDVHLDDVQVTAEK